MTMSLVLFAALAILLVVLLAWATHPRRPQLTNAEEVLKALSEERHYARLPQILQSLQKEDTEYLRLGGHEELWKRIRTERKRIAIGYLDELEEEFRVLLEASRVLATLVPQLSAMGEFDRLASNLRFVVCCRYLRWRLQFGLEPWNVFHTISDMAGAMTLQLEAAMTRLGETIANAGKGGLSPNSRGGGGTL